MFKKRAVLHNSSAKTENILHSVGLSFEEVKAVIVTDITLDGRLEASCLGISQDELIIVSPCGRQNADITIYHKESIPISHIEEAKCEPYSSGGIFLITVSGADKLVARYTNAHSKAFNKLTKLINKLAKGQTPEEEYYQMEGSDLICPKCGRHYEDTNRKICLKCLDKRTIFARVLSFVPRYKWQILFILLCMFASSALKVISPFLSGKIIFDEVLVPEGRYYGKLLTIVLLIAGSQLLSLFIHIIHSRINASMTAKVICDLKSEVFIAMQRLSMNFFSSKQTGALMTRVNYDADRLQYFFHDGVPYMIINGIQLVVIMVIMLLMNWQLALLLFLPVPLMVFIMKKAFPILWTLNDRTYKKSRVLNAVVNDNLTGFRVVKAFGREEAEINRFAVPNDAVHDLSISEGRFKSTLFPSLAFLMGLGSLIIWGVGGWQVTQGTITFGTLVTFTSYIAMLYGPLEFMTHIVDWWTSCMNSAQRIFEMIDSVPDVQEVSDPIRLLPIAGEVELDNVSFAYEPNMPVLKNVSFHVKPGETIGLVGHSGAGKSTITNLISRLYDVNEGCIKIDGHDIKKVSIADLRSQIGMVLQDPFLFRGSIAENIAYANPNAGRAEIIAAAKLANAHDFITKLPDGYDTVIGQKGHDLSGGEKQRISIARAILHNPRILILDEATSSVDTETETKIQEALENLIKGRTTFAIAHRLSTLRNADRLVVLENGQVAEMGTHTELVKNKGVYYDLLQKQREALKIGVKIN
jgi:ATP-binding cassette subfamily B protein